MWTRVGEYARAGHHLLFLPARGFGYGWYVCYPGSGPSCVLRDLASAEAQQVSERYKIWLKTRHTALIENFVFIGLTMNGFCKQKICFAWI